VALESKNKCFIPQSTNSIFNQLQVNLNCSWTLAHSWFDSNIISFDMLSCRSYFPYDMQHDTCCCKRNGKDKEFECNFLIISRYLNLEKKSEDNFNFPPK
jgi:hypothetical protein